MMYRTLWCLEKAFTCRTQPEPRLDGEDQPDHAAMPPEDDIQAGTMATGDSFTPQEGKLLNH